MFQTGHKINKNNEENLKNSSDSLKSDLGNQKKKNINEAQSTKKNSSSNDLLIGDSFNGNIYFQINYSKIANKTFFFLKNNYLNK